MELIEPIAQQQEGEQGFKKVKVRKRTDSKPMISRSEMKMAKNQSITVQNRAG